jgi:DNA-binding transcriptional ArsR family regulator
LRLSIIYLLHQKGVLAVSSIIKDLDKPQNMVSQHLIQLHLKGLLTKQQKGKHVYYGLKQTDLSCLIICLEDLNWLSKI